ncbi:MAG: copper resistance CopC family protein [Pseudonocardia sp.]
MTAVPRLLRAAVATLLAALLLLLATGTAAAHDQLVGSDPADGANLAAAPSKVTLQFNAPVRDQFATITVIGPDGAAYQDGSPTVAGTAISVAVRPLGPAGRYTVGYRVVSSDGHPIQGSLGFTLTTAGAASATTAPSASSAPSTAAQPAADTGAGSAAVWPWVLGGVVLVAGGAAVALRQTRR